MQAAKVSCRYFMWWGAGGDWGASPTAQGPAKWTAALDSADCNFQSRAPTALIERPAFGEETACVGWHTEPGPGAPLVGGGGGLPGSLFPAGLILLLPERLQPERPAPGQRLHVRNGGVFLGTSSSHVPAAPSSAPDPRP